MTNDRWQMEGRDELRLVWLGFEPDHTEVVPP